MKNQDYKAIVDDAIRNCDELIYDISSRIKAWGERVKSNPEDLGAMQNIMDMQTELKEIIDYYETN